MEKILKWYRGYLKCTLYGGNLERFFNMCQNHEICIWNMNYTDEKCIACIFLNDFWKIRKFIKKTKIKIRINERHGLAFVLYHLQIRKGLWIGFLMFIILLYAMTSCIWKIEYTGNSYYTDECLTKYLIHNEGVYFGMLKSRINAPNMEENLRLNFSDISWVSVRTEGTSLLVEIEEMIHYEENDNKNKGYRPSLPCN